VWTDVRVRERETKRRDGQKQTEKEGGITQLVLGVSPSLPFTMEGCSRGGVLEMCCGTCFNKHAQRTKRRSSSHTARGWLTEKVAWRGRRNHPRCSSRVRQTPGHAAAKRGRIAEGLLREDRETERERGPRGGGGVQAPHFRYGCGGGRR